MTCFLNRQNYVFYSIKRIQTYKKVRDKSVGQAGIFLVGVRTRGKSQQRIRRIDPQNDQNFDGGKIAVLIGFRYIFYTPHILILHG